MRDIVVESSTLLGAALREGIEIPKCLIRSVYLTELFLIHTELQT